MKDIDFDHLQGFNHISLKNQWRAYYEHCAFYLANNKPLRPAINCHPSFNDLAEKVVKLIDPDDDLIRQFLRDHFIIYEINKKNCENNAAFITGYYQPVINGSLQKNENYTCPLYARPDDLISFDQGKNDLLPGYYAGYCDSNNRLGPYQTRKEIELNTTAKYKPIIWIRDYVEAFLLHVQGSAIVKTHEGEEYKLSYAGRNGHPYTSIGKILIENGYIKQNEMSLDFLKKFLRDQGQAPDEFGRQIMWENKSYIFFEIKKSNGQDNRPIGGSGLGLNPLVSVAADRLIWPYGTLFWLNADLPLQTNEVHPFSSLVVHQDTGTAIVGPARFDLYMGSGEQAGIKAGMIRHYGRAYVLQAKDNV
jgi:membrane-bound lytic murein transglycosylase A